MKNNLYNKPTAIILGGTFPHIELINKLKERGYYTVLIDFLMNPPAKIAADEHLQESTLDNERVLAIAKNLEAKLVISACIDQANVTACYVSEKLGLFAPYTHETAVNVTNKVLMKNMMIKNNIPTSKYYNLKNISDCNQNDLKFPIVVKPTDSNSSKGVRKACNFNEMQKFLKSAIEISRSGEAIIEEYKEGKEIGVDCFIKNNEATIIMTRERRKIAFSNDPIQQIQGSFWPANLTDKNLDDLKIIATNIANVFDLNNTPLMIQAIVNNNEINVIEFAPRIGGGENYKIIKLHTGFDFIESAINSFLNKKVILDYKLPTFFIADIYLYAKSGLFEKISGYEKLLKDKTIEYFNIYKEKGIEIGSDISSNNRLGSFIVKSKNKKGLYDKINLTIENLEIYNNKEEPIMIKDIYTHQ